LPIMAAQSLLPTALGSAWDCRHELQYQVQEQSRPMT
jgi:hypothetical protein